MKAKIGLTISLKLIAFSCLLTISFLCSCDNIVPEIKLYDSLPLKIDLQNNKSGEIIFFKNELLEPQIIPLGSKDTSFFIASIKKLIVYKKNYFILDKRFSNLIRFDSSGNFIMSYGSIGLGNNEYKKISDFDIDTVHNRIVIFSSANTSFFYYSLQSGTFIKKINTGIYGSQFCIAAGDENLLYRNFSADDKGRNFNIMTFDSSGTQTGQKFLFDEKISDIAWESTGFLKSSNGNILFANAFSDTVYEFYNNSFKPAFEINITSDKVKSSRFNHRKLLETNILIDSTASLLGSELFKNRDFLVFNYQQDKKIKTSIYNLTTKQLYTISADNKVEPLISFFLTPVFLDTENNLFFKFDIKDVLAIKNRDPDLFNRLKKEDKNILNIQNQQSGAFLLRVKINKNPTVN